MSTPRTVEHIDIPLDSYVHELARRVRVTRKVEGYAFSRLGRAGARAHRRALMALLERAALEAPSGPERIMVEDLIATLEREVAA